MTLEFKILLAIVFTAIALLPLLAVLIARSHVNRKIRKNPDLYKPESAVSNAASDSGQESASDFSPAPYRKIAPEEAKAMLDADVGVLLLDVRTEKEYEQEHIAGSILLPEDEVAEKAPEILPDKNATVIVYCFSGGRSQRAAKLLTGMGYAEVYDMGGLLSWPFGTI